MVVFKGYMRWREIIFEEVGDVISFAVAFNSDIYTKEVMEGFMQHFKQLLAGIMVQPQNAMGSLRYLSAQEEALQL